MVATPMKKKKNLKKLKTKLVSNRPKSFQFSTKISKSSSPCLNESFYCFSCSKSLTQASVYNLPTTTTGGTDTYISKNQGKTVALSLNFMGFIIELISFEFWFMTICVMFDNHVFCWCWDNFEFWMFHFVFLIQLMLFMESIRFELNKLGFKLIIGLLFIFNNIAWIEIHFILIDAIR